MSRHAIALALALVAAWLLLGTIAAAASQNLLFDGAMNLEVSRSLAEGHGPRRLYDSQDLFPAGVQTKEPYVLLGAAVFRVFGVGPVQAQLPNLLYLGLLLAAMIVVVRRLAGTGAALASAVLLLSLPQLWQYALNGYGEIPSLAFGFSALGVVSWPGLLARRALAKCALAGLLCGLALATKTVGLVQVGGVGLVLGMRILADSPAPLRDMLRLVGAFLAAFVLPLVLVEWWRWSWLGTQAFLDWWDFQLSRILYQAGVAPTGAAAGGAAEPLSSKLSAHFGILARELHSSRFATACVLAVPLAAAVATHAGQDRASKWLVTGLAAIAVAYIAWWLGITPTEKAWLRRIYVGLACLGSIAAISAGFAGQALLRPGKPRWRVANGIVLVALVATFAPFVARALDQPLEFERTQAVRHTLDAADEVAALPANAQLFGFGWYSAPTVALYSNRRLLDLTDWPIGPLVGAPVYLVADRATFVTGIIDGVLARYPHRQLLADNIDGQVYVLDMARPNDPFDEAQWQAATAMAYFTQGTYESTYGMRP